MKEGGMKRTLAVAALTLLSVLSIAVAGAQGRGGGDSASGQVSAFTLVFDGFSFVTTASIDFSATSSSIGTDANGRFRETFRSQDPDGVITGEIRCLRVAGPLFEARGVVTDVRNVPSFVSQGFVLRGSDSGKFSTTADTFNREYILTQQTELSCLAPTPGGPVVDGDIIVHDAP
jgi:hypothetical protein